MKTAGKVAAADRSRKSAHREGPVGQGARRPRIGIRRFSILVAIPFMLSVALSFIADPWNAASLAFRPAGDFIMELRQTGPAAGEILFVELSGYRDEIWGTWEEYPAGRIGRLAGRSGKDGDVELTFSGNFNHSTEFSGRFSWFGRGIDGEMKGRVARDDGSPFASSRRGAISFAKVASTSPGFCSVSSSGVAFGDRKLFRLAGLEISRPPAAGFSYAMIVRYGLDVASYARMKFEESAGNPRTGIRSFDEVTSPFAGIGGIFSTITTRETVSSATGKVETARYRVFSLYDGGEVFYESLVPPGVEERLAMLLTKRAAEEAAMHYKENLLEAGFFSDTIPADGEFFVCRSGIGFGYDRFRLAPHAAGDFRFVIPWKDARDLLLPEAVERYGLAEATR
jgi:hypothetical protein